MLQNVVLEKCSLYVASIQKIILWVFQYLFLLLRYFSFYFSWIEVKKIFKIVLENIFVRALRERVHRLKKLNFEIGRIFFWKESILNSYSLMQRFFNISENSPLIIFDTSTPTSELDRKEIQIFSEASVRFSLVLFLVRIFMFEWKLYFISHSYTFHELKLDSEYFHWEMFVIWHNKRLSFPWIHLLFHFIFLSRWMPG